MKKKDNCFNTLHAIRELKRHNFCRTINMFIVFLELRNKSVVKKAQVVEVIPSSLKN